jgi:ribosomal protein S18 acetylase RimI-like enzyme
MNMPYSIREAMPDDCAALGVVAPAAYAAAYAYLWEDPAAFVEQLRSFDADAFAQQIEDPQFSVWIAELSGAPVGFLTLKFDSDEPVAKRPGGAEIPRIYFLPQASGRGIAVSMVRQAEEKARAAGARYVWLDAMASADWAQRAYEKWGFEKIGRDRFPKNVKKSEADMVVMIKTLD